MSKNLRTIALFAIVLSVWSSTWLAIRLGLEGVPPVTAAAFRMFASGVILLIVALALRAPWPRQRIYFVHLAVQGSLLFCFQYALLYWAEQTVPSGLAAVLFATLPISTAIIAGYIFRIERMTSLNVLGLLLGFAGVAFIYWSEVINAAHAPAVGVAACLIAATGAAFATVFAKRYAQGISPLATVGPGQLIGGTLLGIIALIAEHGKPIHFTPVSAGALAFLTIFGSSIVFLAYFTLMQSIPVTRLSLLTYVTPVLAVVLGVIVAHEQFAPTTFLGAAVVFAGIWLVNKRPKPTVDAAPTRSALDVDRARSGSEEPVERAAAGQPGQKRGEA
ncbi:MAG TPA: EamA family transporter [Candidatus Eremiobacteraceae bacterium]|nr:EamA family transporter [Candidatus Eremiobacteraceae bacterium]